MKILIPAILFRDGKRQELPLASRVPMILIISHRTLCHHTMVNKIRGTGIR